MAVHDGPYQYLFCVWCTPTSGLGQLLVVSPRRAQRAKKNKNPILALDDPARLENRMASEEVAGPKKNSSKTE